MGKLSPEQQKQFDDLKKIAESPDDDEFSVWVRNADGHETRLTGARAERWCSRNGYDAEDAADATAGQPLDPKAPKPAKAAKAAKAAPAGAPDDADADADAVEPDAEPPRRRNFF